MGKELLSGSSLTEMQAVFVRECSRGTPADVAASIAGYAQPQQTSYNLKSLPHIQAAIASEVRRFLMVEAAPAAVRVMYDFMMDKDMDKKLRLAAAKTVADRAGYIAPKARDGKDLEGKSLTEMTAEEMREMAQRIQRELSDRAVVVIDHAPQQGASASQAIDMFE